MAGPRWRWHPDTCRGRVPCVLGVANGNADNFDQIVSLCPHHAAIRTGLVTDVALHAVVLANTKTMSFARAVAALELGVIDDLIPKQRPIPTLPGDKPLLSPPFWEVASDDRIVFTTGLNSTRRARLQTAINTRVGAGKVTVV